jgi:hypothetical protein
MNPQWFKNRWLEARWGLIYVSFVLTFVTATTVTYTDLPLIRSIFSSIEIYGAAILLLGGFLIAPLIGFFHGKYQNPTDVLKTNQPLLKQIRQIIREELKVEN